MNESILDDHSVVVKAAIALGAEPGVDDLEAALTEVTATPEWIVDLLDDVLLDEQRLRQIRARSYGHPNGFAKIVIHDAGRCGVSVRLHVWPAIEPGDVAAAKLRRDSAPHSHRWEFASTILAGPGLLVEEFRVEPSGGGGGWQSFVFEPSAGPALRPDGYATLTSTEFLVRDRDRDVYWCDADTIHMVGPLDDGMTATLVFQGPEFRDRALVFRRPDSPPDPGRTPLDVEEVRKLVRQVRDAWNARTCGAVKPSTDIAPL
jgi:hypothetical protein